MYLKIQTNRPSLEDLTTNLTLAKLLLKYIAQTKHFKPYENSLLEQNLTNSKE